MSAYEWGVKVIRWYDEDDKPETEIQTTSETDARDKVAAHQYRASKPNYRLPSYLKAVEVKLIKRPVVEWEDVDS